MVGILRKQHGSDAVGDKRPQHCGIHALTGASISLSDYANQKYIPNPGSLSPEVIRICNDILRGDKAASVDTTIVARVAELAGQNSSSVNVRAARDLRFLRFGYGQQSDPSWQSPDRPVDDFV
jgi:hypothetical protein